MALRPARCSAQLLLALRLLAGRALARRAILLTSLLALAGRERLRRGRRELRVSGRGGSLSAEDAHGLEGIDYVEVPNLDIRCERAHCSVVAAWT